MFVTAFVPAFVLGEDPAVGRSLAGAIAFPLLAEGAVAASVDAKTGASGSAVLLDRSAPMPSRKVRAKPMTTTKKR